MTLCIQHAFYTRTHGPGMFSFGFCYYIISVVGGSPFYSFPLIYTTFDGHNRRRRWRVFAKVILIFVLFLVFTTEAAWTQSSYVKQQIIYSAYYYVYTYRIAGNLTCSVSFDRVSRRHRYKQITGDLNVIINATSTANWFVSQSATRVRHNNNNNNNSIAYNNNI